MSSDLANASSRRHGLHIRPLFPGTVEKGDMIWPRASNDFITIPCKAHSNFWVLEREYVKRLRGLCRGRKQVTLPVSRDVPLHGWHGLVCWVHLEVFPCLPCRVAQAFD